MDVRSQKLFELFVRFLFGSRVPGGEGERTVRTVSFFGYEYVHPDRQRRNVISQARKLRPRGHEITARQKSHEGCE